jgi:PEP-CTERM motif
LATAGAVSVAQAKIIDFGLAPAEGTIKADGPTPLADSTGLNFDGSIFFVVQIGAGDSSGLAFLDTVSVTPTNIMYGSGSGSGLDYKLPTEIIKSWTDVLGTFTETLTTVEAISRSASIPDSIGVTLTGTLLGPGFDDTPVSLVLTANQSGGPGSAISASLTNTSSVPEPATWVMLALGFAGLGYAAVRRSVKDRSALAI